MRTQRVELCAADARRLRLAHGDRVLVTDETGTSVHAQVELRDATPAGTAFLERGLASESAEHLRGATVTIAPAPAPARFVPPALEEALA